eukprot:Skav216349  [mRNA]  locus=scaffold2385:122291:123752:- [translate_table: standard]
MSQQALQSSADASDASWILVRPHPTTQTRWRSFFLSIFFCEATMNWTGFRYIVFLVMMQMAQATKDACKGTVGAADVLASAQEMILLIAAFIVGWHLIGPCLGKLLKLLRHETRTTSPNPSLAPVSVAGPGSGNSRDAPAQSETWMQSAC